VHEPLRRLMLVAALLFSGVLRAESASEATPRRVAVAERRQLQSILDRHGSVLLESGGDYRVNGRVLRVSTGQRIEAGWNARLPRIEIAAGASAVELVGLRGGETTDVAFEAGAETHDVRIVGSSAGPGTHLKLLIGDGARVRRLSVSEYGGLEVRQSRSGYVRDSMFARLVGFAEGPMVSWTGNEIEPSSNNVFVGVAAIMPQRGGKWFHPGSLWLLGWNCETWNSLGRGWPVCFTVEDAPSVVSVGLGGGTVSPGHSGALAAFRRVGTLLSWDDSGRGGRSDRSDVLVEQVALAIALRRHAAFGIAELLPDGSGTRANWLPLAMNDEPPLPADVAPLVAATAGLVVPSFGPPPVARPVPARHGARADEPDAATAIQAQIDAVGIARLAPGRYVLAHPLRIGSPRRTEGIVGGGRNLVTLVARGAFPLVTGRGDLGRDPARSMANESVVLAGLTLEGGTHGVQWSGNPGNVGPGATIAFSNFEDLAFLGQSVAGVEVRGITGFDTNFWRRVDFVGMPIAVSGEGHGVTLGMNYADKQFFLDCQFIDVAGAAWSWSSERPSGGEMWQNVLFRRVGQLSRTRAAVGLTWLNPLVDDLAGRTGIEILDTGTTFTGYFYVFGGSIRGRGPPVLTDTQSGGLGTLFVGTDFEQSGGSLVSDGPGQALSAWASRITGSSRLGSVARGVLIDSSLRPDPARVELIQNGRRVRGGGPLSAPSR
jgi:hypothetical protein